MNFLLILSFFFIEEIKLNIRRVKILYVFFKEFSIFRFFAYLFDNSIVPCRDKTFRDYILKNSQKWKNKKYSVDPNNKKILFTNIFHHLGYVTTEIIIGKNLMEIYNAEGIALLHFYDLKKILLYKSFGIKKIIFLKNSNFFVRLKYFIKAYFKIRSFKNMDEFLNFNINGVEMGKSVYDQYVRFSGMGTINTFGRRFYANLARAFLIHHQMEKYFKKYNFFASVQSEQQFIPGSIIFQSALSNGLNVYSRYGVSNFFTVRKYNNISEKRKARNHFQKEIFDLINNNNIKNKAIEIGEEIINKRFSDTDTPEYDAVAERFDLPEFAKGKKFRKIKRFNITKENLCKRFDWNNNSPIAVIFATDLTDGVFDSSWSVFRDRITWLRETFLEIKKIKDVNWLIKPHPNDEVNEVITSTIAEYEKICFGCKHIQIFPEWILKSSVPKFTDFALTLNSSVASEYPCFNIPTIVPCESIGSEFGYTIEPHSKDEYLFQLRNIKDAKKLTNQQIEFAKIYIFILTKLSRVHVNLIPSYGFDHIIEKDYWSEMIKLLEQYSYEDDLLLRMMKIQEKNNHKHSINYDMIMNKNFDPTIGKIIA